MARMPSSTEPTFSNRSGVLRHPTRAVGDLPGQRKGHGDGADLDFASSPERDGERRRAHDEGRIQTRQRDAKQTVEPQMAAITLSVAIDRIANPVVSVAQPCKQFPRQNVRCGFR
jgi:hypothetical protein